MKLNNLQVLRAIAAYLVLLAHIEDVEKKYGEARILGTWTNAGDWGVDLFFVLSGFVMVMVSRDTLGSVTDAGKFLWSRATRIYPIWWLCLTALIAIWFVRPEIVYGGGQQEINFFKDFLLIPKTESPLLETGWTLVHEMYFYVIFALLLLMPVGERGRLPLIAVWGVIAISAGLILHPTRSEEPLLTLITHPMTLEFIAGAFCAVLWKTTRGALGVPALIAGCVYLLIGMSCYVDGFLFRGQNPPLTLDWARVLFFLPSAALLTYGAASIELRQGWKAEGLPVSLGDWSYSLYLTHMLSANGLGLIWGKVAMPGLVDNVFGLIGITVGCTIIASLSYKLFEQPILKRAKLAGARLFPKQAVAA